MGKGAKMIVLVDFGGQTAHLISRRIKELGVKVLTVYPDEALEKVQKEKPQGIIFSGGPASVYDEDSPTISKDIFNLKIPVLGICYGEQLLCQLLDGQVKPGFKKEFGPAELLIKESKGLLKDVPSGITVWMSHGDEVVKVPTGFETLAKTKTIPHAVIEDNKKKIYGIQFHPEVVHTEIGEKVLENFLKTCKLQVKKQQIDKGFVEDLILD
ncbi:glutamine-hydrolyzing GMP synthase, partial [Candidatus Daviesbacteria bacterium]|nr:glutamine-hydrolyzing GMP synthase [Candidatus Daviesbacteria bacterium]